MSHSSGPPFSVVGIGEILFDLFPDGAVLGGAPGNVACHAAAGSVLVADARASERAARATTVVDTVGAGDAFTAALIVGLLRGRPLDDIHDHASRLAAFVCSRRGGTPTIPASLRE